MKCSSRFPESGWKIIPPGLARNVPPGIIGFKPGAKPVWEKQCYTPPRVRAGIQCHLDRLSKYRILRLCQSCWNTPVPPVQKPGTEDYRSNQDLRAINEATVTLHPVVPNPYTLQGLIPPEAIFFTCLDLKDAFFCICPAPKKSAGICLPMGQF